MTTIRCITILVEIDEDVAQGDEYELALDQVNEAFSRTGTSMGWNLPGVTIDILDYLLGPSA